MNSKTTGKVFVIAALSIVVMPGIGCGQATPQLEVEEAGPQQVELAGITGEVLETMDAGNYTYVRVNTGSEEMWVAAPRFEVAVGSRVTFPPGAPMADFHSASMDRTFELIYFVEQIVPEGAQLASARLPEGHPPLGQAEGAAQAVEPSAVEKATGGYSVAEIFEQKAELAGQTVALRGKVVKVNLGILGANWLHIQDGSGSAADGTNDLTVTTSGMASVGQTVTVVGMLELDKDFGAGYRYNAIVTDAQVTVE
jgi:hypothetical protein